MDLLYASRYVIRFCENDIDKVLKFEIRDKKLFHKIKWCMYLLKESIMRCPYYTDKKDCVKKITSIGEDCVSEINDKNIRLTTDGENGYIQYKNTSGWWYRLVTIELVSDTAFWGDYVLRLYQSLILEENIKSKIQDNTTQTLLKILNYYIRQGEFDFDYSDEHFYKTIISAIKSLMSYEGVKKYIVEEDNEFSSLFDYKFELEMFLHIIDRIYKEDIENIYMDWDL